MGTDTRVSAILNLTPDSFSDAGLYRTADDIDRFLHKLVVAGVPEVDVGACSTRPGAAPVAVQEELGRLASFWEILPDYVDRISFSVDTSWRVIAEVAVGQGVGWINDVSFANHDRDLLPFVAEAGCGYIVMHNRGTPATMNSMQEYAHGVDTILEEIGQRLDQVGQAGISSERLRLDPGLGFAKNAATNLDILRQIDRFRRWQIPLYVGPSRKRFVGKYSGIGHPADRDSPTLAVAGFLADHGVETIRIHAAVDAVAYLTMRGVLAGARGCNADS